MEPGMPPVSFNMPYGADGCSCERIEQRCINGHIWEADMFRELGGLFYVHDEDERCSECGEWSEI